MMKISHLMRLLLAYGALFVSNADLNAVEPKLLQVFQLEDQPLEDIYRRQSGSRSVRDTRGIMLGGFSDLHRAKIDPPSEYWAITDRGPNGKTKYDGFERRTFPIPDYAPMLVRFKLADERMTILETQALMGRSGKPITGLHPTEIGYDYRGRQPVSTDSHGVDPEGMVRLKNGSFWIAEEYLPSLLKVGSDGKVAARYAPTEVESANDPNRSTPDFEIQRVLPAVYARRQDNHGFESLSVDPSERILYATFQAPLGDQSPAEVNTKSKKVRSRNVRILAFDLKAEKPKAEYLYQLGEIVPAGRRTSAREIEIGATAMIDENRMLVLEHADAMGKLYSIDFQAATNTLTHPRHATIGPNALEKQDDLSKVEVEPVKKRFICDLSAIAKLPNKLEGLVIIDDRTVAIVNDNDYGFDSFTSEGKVVKNKITTRMMLIQLPESLEEKPAR